MSPVPEPSTEQEIYAWRKAMRERLLAERLRIQPSARRAYAGEIARHVLSLLGPLAGRIVSLYWPIRAEPDLRALATSIRDAGGSCALPVVVEKKAPMVFRLWEPGAKLVPGIWNIPVPPSGAPVIPDAVLAPVVGFDQACFRLGYGGGYFDRTLASMPKRPFAIGVAYADAALATIYPLPHDVPLDAVVTERGILQASEKG
jgi:5,10-methenyltetrahydrofolate synthetase